MSGFPCQHNSSLWMISYMPYNPCPASVSVTLHAAIIAIASVGYLKKYPISYFHIDITEVKTEEGKLYLFVAIDHTNSTADHAYVRPLL